MMNIDPMLIVRALQGILALVAMATGATVANILNTHNPSIAVPNSVIFYIFTAVFTLLVTVPYTIVAPRYFQVLAHPFAMLAAEATTSIFWLVSFAAFADFLRRSRVCEVGACASARGSVVVGVLEFILFGVTTFFAFSHVFLGGRFSGGKAVDKQQQSHKSWSGAESV
ncbi:hypothetical protein PV05_06270 [Exophiala xenobiotica]|uniref:MARVEL domain-containing protein n=1 Tax=Exophiala xenobiotica TaxID=348802 RepID=A0A0D2F1L0_9EURO|nr:uncharacterized protein PV05_06270 [Exophiala xenobiotica]KIW53859.1 hypothetical protein PV05_06270 [Exophiala xenobiotica]